MHAVLRSGRFRLMLCLLAAACFGYGLWPRSEPQRSQRVVEQFLQALKQGDRETAERLMGRAATGSRGNALLADTPASAEADPAWKPSPDLKWKILKSMEESGHALVRVSLREKGIFVEPELSLLQDSRGNWRISRIELVREDPRLETARRDQARQSDLQLAAELEQALQGATGIIAQPDDATRSVRR